ncbi:hypothetical protein [Auritidibacter sp. NML100628]|uniref:hypothetical protein n=1 Tax=Auritidibacter sp. NML100628 TaxID=2170742 RepID=UPI000D7391F7|nr:hypothetical protein [Auritidibacter sp. NML100628]PXA76985.1 hypothetical protein DCC24_05125 [Auritidibacter sp. NML100628]
MSSRRSARRASQSSQQPGPEDVENPQRISPTTLGLVLMGLIGVLMLATTLVLKLISDHLSVFILTLGLLLILIPAGFALWRRVTRQQKTVRESTVRESTDQHSR